MGFRRHIERNYTDRATISRMTKHKTEKGETRQSLLDVYTNVPCRISQKSLGTNNQGETYNSISYETKLFISPNYLIQQGDTITITRNEVVRTFQAGEPFPYPTHQEVSLEKVGKA